MWKTKRMKKKDKDWEKILQSLYLTKHLHLEYIKNSQKLVRRKQHDHKRSTDFGQTLHQRLYTNGK